MPATLSVCLHPVGLGTWPTWWVEKLLRWSLPDDFSYVFEVDQVLVTFDVPKKGRGIPKQKGDATLFLALC
jgi:hypothetical protein